MSKYPLLFVYGTLCRGQQAHSLLNGQARYLGRAWMAGALYNLGRYPGAIPASHTRRPAKVHGELYRVLDEARLMKCLDAYEGLGHTGGEYRREQLMVNWGRRRVTAWVYLYDRPTGFRRPLTSGHYHSPHEH